ncbi:MULTISPECIES: cupin domain-containing protein [Flammeovirga]|uniref:Cupin domain-containing protein n=1 Tax=Flammeovirga agarivorans TaxID=2726742 RepID=A0A7X8SQF1_9BACT|nr:MULTISPECIES: cupin domain-containing protein [Flammeovirga]NLR94416.1 cupin domain-containing protein [Flammeovirga agarivorans]
MEKIQSQAFFVSSENEWEELGNGIKRQIIGYDNQLMAVKVLFEKGAVGTPHEHFHSQVTYCVSGSFKMRIGDQEKVINAGDAFYCEPHVEHEALCLEDGMLIDTFGPARMDFLDGSKPAYLVGK